MDNDDRPVGRILSRREILALFGVAGVAALAGCAAPARTTQSTAAPATGASTDTPAATEPPTPAATTATEAATEAPSSTATSAATAEATAQAAATTSPAAEAMLPACVVSPEMTEGPYFVDEKLNRSDVRANTSDGAMSAGTPLVLALRVGKYGSNGCTPLAGADVDIWHCDAAGVYSDATDRSFNTQGQDFLRGYQTTDANGLVKFTTIYPGWYQGRAVHIHFKVRGTADSGQTYEFTSQFFFDESITDVVHAEQPYAAKGKRTLLNEGDGIYQNGGNQTTLSPVKSGDNYEASFDIGLSL